jgi:hypothetical protein
MDSFYGPEAIALLESIESIQAAKRELFLAAYEQYGDDGDMMVIADTIPFSSMSDRLLNAYHTYNSLIMHNRLITGDIDS